MGFSRWLKIAAVTWGATACGGVDDAGTGDDGVAVSTGALAPAGSNAQLITASIPSMLFPGERRAVTVTMRNTGATPGTNDWTTSSPPYAFSAQKNGFGWNYTYVPGTVAVGAEQTFSFVITAPPTSQSFVGRMSAVGLGAFGDTVTAPVTIDASVTPQWGCTLVSDTVPASLAPGENRWVTVTVRNSGTEAWRATGLKLATRDLPANLWGATNADLTTAVAPGGTATFGFNLRAPSTAGTYTFQREMKDYAGIGDFRSWNFCVSKSISVAGVGALGAAVASQDFATTLRPGEQRSVNVVMQNTGGETWAADGTYLLYSLNTPVNLWGRTQAPVATATVSGASASFSLFLTAPATPGDYRQKWQMRKVTGQNAGFFGQVIDVPVTVPVLKALDAALVSANFPAEMTLSERKTVTVVMKNTGSQPWNTSEYALASPSGQTLPLTGSLANATPGGADGTFTVFLFAPSTAGDYRVTMRMRRASASGQEFFGEVIDVPIKVKNPDVPAVDARIATTDVRNTAIVEQKVVFNGTARNTGIETWDTTNFVLESVSTPPDLWGPTRIALSNGAAFDSVAYFNAELTAPATAGTHVLRWQMRKLTGPNAGLFGQVYELPVTVGAIAPGNHRLIVNAGDCGFGGALVQLYGYPTPEGFLKDTCARGQTCGYEALDGEELWVRCWQPGMTFVDAVISTTPLTTPNGGPVCRTDTSGGPEGLIDCDVFGVSQSYTLSVGWKPFEEF